MTRAVRATADDPPAAPGVGRDRLRALPGLGEWDGPVFGRLGVVAVEPDGQRIQCHACGRFYRSVATHAWLTHRLLADEYRAIFGLAAQHGLVSPALADRWREHARTFLVPHHLEASALGREVMTRQGLRGGHGLRLETRLDPRWQEVKRAVGRRAAERLRDGRLAEALRALDAAAFDRLAPDERRVVRLYFGVDPADPRPHSRRELIEATGLRRGEVDQLLRLGTERLLGPDALGLTATCAACGRPFARSAVSPARTTCSDACARARSVATVRANGRLSAAARARGRAAAEELRAIEQRDPTAFAALPDVERLAVRLYHGLPLPEMAVTRPWTKPEIALHLGDGVTVWQITEALRRGLARLRSEQLPSPEERRAAMRAKISAAARQRDRGAVGLLRALPPEAFDPLSEQERRLVRDYYGLADGRSRTRRELAAEFGRSTEWVARAVARSVARLLGEQALPPVARVCVVCGSSFAVGPAALRSTRQACSDTCNRELRRRRAIESRVRPGAGRHRAVNDVGRAASSPNNLSTSS